MDTQEQTEKIAVFYATISASQSPGHLGYAEGISTIKEARSLVMQTIPERRGRVTKTTDDTVAACFRSALEALKAGIAIQRGAIENRDKKAPLNIRIFIHFGDQATQEVDNLLAELMDFATRTSEITKPGHVYVSSEASSNAQGLNAVEFKPVGEATRQGQMPYHDVLWHPETDCTPGGTVSAQILKAAGSGSTSTFLHGTALLTGPNTPCFYCGSGRHKTTACPSKQLTNSTNGLERLGHHSMDEINRLFSDYLSEAGDDLPVVAEPVSKDDNLTYLAAWAFYELKRAFQLRFLDIIWNASPKEDWYKARESKREGSPEGGMLWLARDCIRTCRLEEAEDLLKRYDRKNQSDYRTQVGLAFVKIEKENYLTAGDFLIEALNLQTTTPLQKTYLLLLLCRIYDLIGDQGKSEERLRDALSFEPYCPEATLELVVRYFKARRTTDATNRLIKLIHVCREYYTAALITPELVKFQEHFAAELEKIMDKAREDAHTAAVEAERAVTVLANFAGESDTDVAEVLSYYQEMKNLLEGPEALFNYVDVAAIGERVSARCAEVEQECAKRAAEATRSLENQVGEAIRDTTQPRKAKALVQPILDRVSRIKEDIKARAPLAPCLSECGEMAKELEGIAETIKSMDASHALFMMWARFSKDLMIVFFITAAVGFVIFPGAMNLMSAASPEMTVLKPAEVWGAQKAIVLSGTLFALMFAGFRAFMMKHNPQKDE